MSDCTVRLPAGTIRYVDRGTGRPVVFVHGFLTNGTLWRKVVPRLADAGFRCIAPDWPLGSHSIAMDPEADLSPPGLAGLIVEFLAQLDLDDVVLVGNDTGGALAQMVAARKPDRVGMLVLTPCDAFRNWPAWWSKPLRPIGYSDRAIAGGNGVFATQPYTSGRRWTRCERSGCPHSHISRCE